MERKTIKHVRNKENLTTTQDKSKPEKTNEKQQQTKHNKTIENKDA